MHCPRLDMRSVRAACTVREVCTLFVQYYTHASVTLMWINFRGCALLGGREGAERGRHDERAVEASVEIVGLWWLAQSRGTATPSQQLEGVEAVLVLVARRWWRW